MVKKHRPALAGLAVAAAALASGSAAQAQTIDYGSLEQLFGEPVTTSATGKPQRVTDVPITMEIISSEDIRRAAARDLPGILREYTNLDVWQWSRSAADVSVRGYNQPYSPRLLVLINGRQVYLDHYGMTAWSTLPVQLGEIRQIEVVKGPNSALFGFNAVSGVINIITFNPLYDSVSNAAATAGTGAYGDVSLVKTFKFSDRAGVRLSFGGSRADNFSDERLYAPERELAVEPRRRAINLDSLIQVTDKSQLGIELSHSAVRQNEFFPNWELNYADYKTYSGKLQYTYDSATLGLIEATVYRNSLKVDLDTPSFPRTTVDNDVTVARLQDLFKVGTDHSFRLSAEYRHNAMKNVAVGAGKTQYDVYSASGMWDWTIGSQVTLNNAVRVDHLRLERTDPIAQPVPGVSAPFSQDDYDRKITGFSFNSGLVYKPTQEDTLRFSVGRGLQIPTLIELGYLEPRTVPTVPGAVALFSGNPYLKPTTVMNYEASYDRSLPQIGATGRLTAFYQTSDRVKSLPSVTPSRQRGRALDFYFDNIGTSRAWGIEAGLDGKIGETWRWGASYTYESVKDDLTVNRTALTNSTELDKETPRHKLGANLGFTAGKWEGDVFGQYVSGYEMLRRSPTASVYFRERIPAYLVLDARLGYAVLDNLTVAVRGTSLNQADFRQTSGPEVERQLFLSLHATF